MFSEDVLKEINMERIQCEHQHAEDFGFLYDREKDLEFILHNYANPNMTKDLYSLAIFAVQYIHREIGMRKANECLELIENKDVEGFEKFLEEHHAEMFDPDEDENDEGDGEF